MSVVDKIQHYQRSLERCTDNELRTLHCIDKLYKLPVTVQHLKETGVGRTVNALRKFDGSVGDAAKALVAKWKTMVVDDESSEEEDEACVPDAPEGYSDRSNSPKFDRDNGDDRNSSNYKTCESREKTSRSTDKHESSRHGTKNSSSSSENSKPRENELKSSRETSSDKYKCSKNGTTEKKYTKSETKSEKKSKSSRDSKDTRSESRGDSGKEASTSSRSRVKTEDSRKDSSRVSSSSSTNGGSSKNSNNHDSHRKRKLDSSSSERESSKRRKSVESPVEDEYDDPDEVATQVLSRDSDDEAGKVLPDTSIESDSEDEARTKTKIKCEIAASPPMHNERSSERDVSHSKHSGKAEKSSKSKSRESSSKTTSGGSEKSRRDSDRSEKSKSERSVEHRKNEKRKDRSPGKESSSKSKSHGSSSSSSKDHLPSKEKDEYSETSKGKRDKSDCDSKDSKEKFKEPKDKKVKKKKISKDDGIDCNSGASFAEALGMCTDRPAARKKPNPVSPSSPSVKTVKSEPGTSASSSAASSSTSGSRSIIKVKSEPQASSDPEPLSLLAPNVKLEPLNVDLASTLPEISPNYKPLPAHYINPVHRKAEESRALSDVIYAKTQRTKVYSGMKSGYTSVPTLCEEAIRVLIENIHELGFTGGIPYDIIKPVLERATPDQLFTVENYNPYLIEDTDQLWEFHCNREFRTKKREEMESWRDMYLRCREEREAKLKALTANIKESIDKSVPVRSAKLAYVDKPPRNVLRQQAKYGTAKISTSSSDLKKQMILSGSSNSATNIAVPPPPMSRHKSSSSGVMKKNKAPLMAKALQLIKGRYKR